MKIVFLVLLIESLQALYFNLQKGSLKCFLDESPAETHIVAYYQIMDKLEKD